MAKKPRIKRTELDDLVDVMEAADTFWQPEPDKVDISDGQIRVEYRRLFGIFPLASGDLFTSFAKLAARGEPSEAKIKHWVSRFGLPVWGRLELEPISLRKLGREGVEKIPDHLWRTNPDYKREEAEAAIEITAPKPAPISMSVAEFREEARYAHDLLGVYLQIRGENAAAIRARVKAPESRLDREFREAFKANRRRWGLYPGPDMGREHPGGTTYQELRDWMVLQAARSALGEIITRQVSGIRLRVGIQDTRGLAPSWECPDLASAIYLQFYLLATKSKPIRYCENPACGQPFVPSRRNQRHCPGDSCRSNARHYR